MEQEIPNDLVEKLLSLGGEGKEYIKCQADLIELLQRSKPYSSEYYREDWQSIADSLSRENLVLLFNGLIYADILAWGPSTVSPANVVFLKLNKICWPDTVYQIIWWAVNVCEYHNVDVGHYAFKGMLENR